MKTEAGKSRIEKAEARPTRRPRNNNITTAVQNKIPTTPPGPAPGTPPPERERIEDAFIEDSQSESEAQNDPIDVDTDIASIARTAYVKIASEMLEFGAPRK